MRPLLVVTKQPVRSDLAHLLQRFEHLSIEHLGAIRAIEPLDERILIRLEVTPLGWTVSVRS